MFFRADRNEAGDGRSWLMISKGLTRNQTSPIKVIGEKVKHEAINIQIL